MTLGNSSEHLQICNYSAVAPGPSITALSELPSCQHNVRDSKLRTRVFACLLSLSNTTISYTTGRTTVRGGELCSFQFWPLTPTARRREWTFSKTLLIHPETKKNCSHKKSNVRISSCLIILSTQTRGPCNPLEKWCDLNYFVFLLRSVRSPEVVFRCQNSKVVKKETALSVISAGINHHVWQKNCLFLPSFPGIKIGACDWGLFVSQWKLQIIREGKSCWCSDHLLRPSEKKWPLAENKFNWNPPAVKWCKVNDVTDNNKVICLIWNSPIS